VVETTTFLAVGRLDRVYNVDAKRWISQI